MLIMYCGFVVMRSLIDPPFPDSKIDYIFQFQISLRLFSESADPDASHYTSSRSFRHFARRRNNLDHACVLQDAVKRHDLIKLERDADDEIRGNVETDNGFPSGAIKDQAMEAASG